MPRGVYVRTEQNRINIGKSKKGQRAWNKGIKTGHIPWNKGKNHSEETKRKVSETKKSQNRRMTDEEKKRLSDYNKSIGKRPPIMKMENNPNWMGGKSYEKYPVDWTKSLRIAIRERDKYRCRMCGEQQGDEALSVHHIDYNKKNCNPNNLISLCRLCHGKTAKNRDYWINYFNKYALYTNHCHE